MSELISHSESRRKPLMNELNLFQLLCSVDFDGKKQVVKQLESCFVSTVDADGSLELFPVNLENANVSSRVPVEVYGYDSDGVIVHVLLHIVDGLCKELEIYKDTPTKIANLPVNWFFY